jgi:CRISPR-associated protein Cas1
MLPISQDDLWSAWERVRENEGCAGADGVTVHAFAQRVQRALAELLARVREGRYRPYPLLKIVVEKRPGSGKTRTLLVPAVRDRVLQTAVARLLSRSFEEEFLECSYGYRPGRSVDRAIARIRKCRELGYIHVADADIEAFFDRVDHDLLLERLAARQPGEDIMALLRMWVRCQSWDGSNVRAVRRGVPQGSPISPLLANFFLEDFDRELEKSGRKLVRYADDFIILAKTAEEANQALLQSRELLEAAHLELNLEKTRITDFEHGFKFLGVLFLGNAIWAPWKFERAKGRMLFMAPPLPPSRRAAYELAPPRNTMELALERAGATTAMKEPPGARRPAGPRSTLVAYLYLTEQGSILRKAGDRFLVEKDDEVLLDLPYHKLETVLLFGNVQVTTQALAELLEKGVSLSLFSREGHFRGSLAPPRGHHVELRLAQFDRYRDAARAADIARAVVEAKIANGLAVLAHYREKNPVSAEFDAGRSTMETAMAGCAAASGVADLDGHEGAAARAYFTCLMEFNKSAMKWPGRQKHPATDPLNALLSLGYTLLMHELTGLLEGAGIDPYLGYLHQPDRGRPSLALDLMEPFRHPAVDRLVLNLVNREMVQERDFHTAGDRPGVFLAPQPMKKFFAEYEHWMLERPQEGEPRWRELLKTEVEKLAAALGRGTAFVPYRWRAEGPAEKDEGKGNVPCNTSSVTI